MLIIKETIIAKCQTCLLTQTFEIRNNGNYVKRIANA